MKRILVLISIATAVSGLVQMVAPAFVLSIVGGEATPTSRHFFGIVGMFMLLFGGLLLHTLRSATPNPIAVVWCGLQKFGAFVAVALGVSRGLFASVAWLVAGFDLLTAVLIFAYWRSLRGTR